MTQPSTWHLLTSEYPPLIGGVSDHSRQIAEGLAAAGLEVHVWTRRSKEASGSLLEGGVHVHRELASFSRSELQRLSGLVDRTRASRRILVQWVPHSFGFASMNLGICSLLSRRKTEGDSVQVIVHEPGLPFSLRKLRWNLPALIHRIMAALLIRAADRIWVAAPLWEERWRPYAFGARTPFEWLPLPNGIPVIRDVAAVQELRSNIPGDAVVGYFGLAQAGVSSILARWVRSVLESTTATVVLIGKGGEEMKERIAAELPASRMRIVATGALDPGDVSLALQACDVMIQPYEGGANARRSSLVAAIAHGKPVVTTTGYFTEQLWREGGVALVDEQDVRTAAERVANLLQDETQRRSLAEAAYSLYDQQFSLTRVIDRLLDRPPLD